MRNTAADHFWDKPVNRVKEAVLVKREDYPLEAAREYFSSIIDAHNNDTPCESVIKSLHFIDCDNNYPVEDVLVENDIYIRPCEEKV